MRNILKSIIDAIIQKMHMLLLKFIGRIKLIAPVFIILILIIFIISVTGCIDDDEYDDDTCVTQPAGCVTTPYTEGTLTVNLTQQAGVTQTLNIYEGDIDPANPPVPLSTVYVTDSSYSTTLPVGLYSAMVTYIVGSSNIIAVDGDSITNTSTQYCEGPCYVLGNATIDLTFDENAFNDFQSGKDDKCFIATAAYGSLFTEEVTILRKFRDSYLITNKPGRYFVKLYYKYSPPIAGFIKDKDYLRFAVRCMLTPVVFFIKHFWAFPLFVVSLVFISIKLFKNKKNYSVNYD